MLKKIDFTNIPKELKSKEEIGAWILTKVMNNLDLIETDLTKWLSSLTGQSEKDIEELSLPEIKQLFTDLATENNLKSFFVSVSQHIQT